MPKGRSQPSAAAGSEDAACAMALASSQEVTGVADEPDPDVILELNPCGNLVVACNFVTRDPVKYGDKYAPFFQATWGPPVYFQGGVENANCTWTVSYEGVLPEEGMTQKCQ